MALSEYTMPIGDVARALGVTTERVRQLDGELKPARVGRYRRYDPAIVQRVLRARQHAATETDSSDAPTAALAPEVAAEFDAMCAAFLESRRRVAEAALAEDAALANLRRLMATRLDAKTRELFEDRARARKKVLQIGHARDREGVIYLNDPEVEAAEASLAAIDRRIGQRVQALLSRPRSSERPAQPERKAPWRPRSRRRRARGMKSSRAPADPEPHRAMPSSRGPL